MAFGPITSCFSVERDFSKYLFHPVFMYALIYSEQWTLQKVLSRMNDNFWESHQADHSYKGDLFRKILLAGLKYMHHF